MLRSDAQDNRDRLLEAARDLFGERGTSVPMREVARRAGVGPATLYRRFPTRQDLLDAALADEMAACRTIVEEGWANDDAWEGLCDVIERLSLLNARNQGFVDAFLADRPGLDVLAGHRAGLLRKLAELGRRAQASGELRSDFAVEDLLLVLTAGRALGSMPPARRPIAARRLARLAIDAFRTPAHSPPAPGVPGHPAEATRPRRLSAP
jgi:AcrR family transcriptional regulator